MALQDDILIQNLLLGMNSSPQGGGLSIGEPAVNTDTPPVDKEAEFQAIMGLLRNASTQGALPFTVPANPMTAPKAEAPTKQIDPAMQATIDAIMKQATRPATDVVSLEQALANRDTKLEQQGIPKNVPVEPQDLRVNALNAQLGSPIYKPSDAAMAGGASSNRIVAGRDEKGNVSFTNINTGQLPSVRTDLSQANKPAFSDKMLDETIQAMTNGFSTSVGPDGKTVQVPLDKMQVATKLVDTKNQIDAFVTEFSDKVLNTNKMALGIPALEAKLPAATQKDNELIAQGLPANNAKALMAQIQANTTIAEQRTKDAVASNMLIRSAEGKYEKLKAVSSLAMEKAGFVEKGKLEDELIDQQMPLSTKTNVARLMQMDKDEEEATGKTSALNPADPSSRQGYLKRLDTKQKAVLEADPRNLPAYALSDPDNTIARKLLVANMRDSGKSTTEIDETLRTMSKLNTDPKMFESAFRAMYPTPELQAQMQYLKKPDLLTNKQAQEDAKLARIQMVIQPYMDTIAREKFTNDVRSWMPVETDPTFKQAYADTVAAGLVPNLENVGKMFVGSDPATAMAKYKVLSDVTATRLKNMKRDVVGNVDSTIVMAELPRVLSAARASNLSRAVDASGSALSNMSKVVAPYTFLQPSEVAGRVAEPIKDMFNWAFSERQLQE